MTGASYVPGSWLGIVRSRTAVLLGPETTPALADALWSLLADTPEVHEVLHAVTSSSGGSLASIPSFGILDFTGPLRVFLRGELELSVALPDGIVELNGRDVTTWNERRFDMPGLCTLTIPDAGAQGQPELPLGEGAVLLQSLTLALGTGQAAVGTGQAAAGAGADAAVVAGALGGTQVHDAGSEPVSAVPVSTFTVEPAPASETGVGAADALQGGIDGETAIEGHQDAEAGADAPELTVSPEHGVSAETVLEVPYDDSDHHDADPNEADPNEADRNEADPNEAAHDDAGFGTHPGGEAGSAPAEAVTASDLTGSYDHLWERTVIRNIEDAAVREDPETDEAGPAPSHGPAQAPALEPAARRPALERADDGEAADTPTSGGDLASAPGPGPVEAPGHRPGPENRPASPVRPAQSGILIDSVPWRTGNPAPAQAQEANLGAPPAAAAHIAAPPAPPAAGSPGTPDSPGTPPSAVPAPVAGTAPPERSGWQGGAQPPAAGDFDGDHDGQTVMKGSLAGMVSQPAPAASADPAEGPTVLARICAQGHANPPTRAQCAACGSALLPDAVQVARPRLGRMRLSTGELLDLDQSLVIGRQPSVSRVQGGVMPRLVQVASPGGDISRSHVEVRLEGWHVMLCDLKATNGTVLVRDGQPPRRLAQNEMAILLDGDVAELGDNISLRFEEIP
jgi:hypothetical protein